MKLRNPKSFTCSTTDVYLGKALHIGFADVLTFFIVENKPTLSYQRSTLPLSCERGLLSPLSWKQTLQKLGDFLAAKFHPEYHLTITIPLRRPSGITSQPSDPEEKAV